MMWKVKTKIKHNFSIWLFVFYLHWVIKIECPGLSRHLKKCVQLFQIFDVEVAALCVPYLKVPKQKVKPTSDRREANYERMSSSSVKLLRQLPLCSLWPHPDSRRCRGSIITTFYFNGHRRYFVCRSPSSLWNQCERERSREWGTERAIGDWRTSMPH